ncbi:spindle and kinetochore-associated protein 1-like isoform X2 [Bombus affinis]|uniref:spindle and kinetochore-associated protein 1-like isoform X2 n=1 Tax=Bombus affinis TaxID=309941 RepID=UPI0021B78A3C|nr:spindle and kinetochore-associated protein 1-like isoform X2 [Bombus affinis]
MSTSYTLEEILERQCEKLQDLEIATIFVKSKDAMKEELLKMRTAVSQKCNDIEIMRQKLDEMKKQNNQCRELMLHIKAVSKKINHMKRNIPSELIHDYYETQNSLPLRSMAGEEFTPVHTVITDNREKQETPMIDCKKVLFNEPEVCLMISLIGTDEFSKIPKYIIGRQSLETVNNFINTINQILKAKYMFLSLGKAHARKQGDLNLYLHYKKQEMDICNDNKYVYFFTGEDYERQTKSKLDKLKLNLMIVLRHCKRLREHRIKNDVRYIRFCFGRRGSVFIRNTQLIKIRLPVELFRRNEDSSLVCHERILPFSIPRNEVICSEIISIVRSTCGDKIV